MPTLKQRADWLAHLWKAATQQHHRELLPILAPHVPADGVVIDVGAHAGQFSKLFARMAPRGHVYAFEPSDYARSILTRALAWNRIGNVTVIPAGLSDTPGASVLKTPIKRHGGLGFGIASLGDDAGGRETVDQTVALTTLDAFAAEAGLTRLDFLKADVEGWEAHVLKGGPATLAKFRPALLLEVVETSLAKAGTCAADIFGALEPLGYSASVAPLGEDGGETTAFRSVPGFAGPGDYLFVPI